MPSPALSNTASRHWESGAACPGLSSSWVAKLGGSPGLVSAASSSWLHKRAAVNSVTREVFLEIQHHTRDQSMHDNKCPLRAGDTNSALTCLVGIWRQTKMLPGQ